MTTWNPSDLIAHQQAMNRETWKRLTSHGVTQETELRLDFLFLAETRGDADTLAAFLCNETDYDLEARDRRVAGSTQPTTVNIDVLDEWVEWMVLAGWENGVCRFDGWGTEIP